MASGSESLMVRLTAWYERQKRRKTGYVIGTVAERYSEDSVSMRAGMVAYFTFLSLFPLLLLVISITSAVVPSAEAQQTTFRLLSDFPDDVRTLLQENIAAAYAARGPVTLIGLAALLWSSLYVFSALALALNQIAPYTECRSWYSLYLRGVVIVGLTLGLVAAIFAADFISDSFGSILAPFLPPGISEAFLAGLAWAFSLAGSFALFLTIYTWVPAQRAGWRRLWPGALLAAVLWKLSKTVLGWYFTSISADKAVYGSIGAIMAVLVWLYVSAIILLLGAELNRALAEWRRDQSSCESDDSARPSRQAA